MTLPSERRLLEANRTINRAGMLNAATKRTLADRWYDVALDLARRADAGDVGYDGFGSGGYVEIRGSDDPERLTPLEAHMERLIEDERENQQRAARNLPPLPKRTDPTYELAERLCNAYVEAAANLKIVDQCLELLPKISVPGKGIGQTVAMCSTVGGHEQLRDIPCGEQAVTNGLCDACRKRLSRLNAKRATQGLDSLSALPKEEADELFANRGKRRHYETGPLAS